jgi:DNA-binding transcriptional regulator GbsR (MarR family)
LTAFERELVEHFENLAAMLGVPRSYGAIYGLLYVSPRSLSFTDIQMRLELSKGSISQGLRALREVGAIRPAVGADQRREHFVPETELRKLIGGFLRESIQPHLKGGTVRIEMMKARYSDLLTNRTDHSRLLAGRLEKLRSWHLKGGMLLPLISRFLA